MIASKKGDILAIDEQRKMFFYLGIMIVIISPLFLLEPKIIIPGIIMLIIGVIMLLVPRISFIIDKNKGIVVKKHMLLFFAAKSEEKKIEDIKNIGMVAEKNSSQQKNFNTVIEFTGGSKFQLSRKPTWDYMQHQELCRKIEEYTGIECKIITPDIKK